MNEASEASWRQRFRAPRVTLPRWAEDAPERLVYASNKSGKWEVYAWDRAADTHRQVTDRREGTLDGYLSPSGAEIWWFNDTDGDEFGQWIAQDFTSDERRVVAESLGRKYSTGLHVGRSAAVIGTTDDDAGTAIHVLTDGEEPRQVYHSAEASWLGGMSADERLICFHHAENNDSRHPELRVIDIEGNVVADLSDGPDLRLESVGFPQAVGDDRILVLHERIGLQRPLIWWPRTGETRQIELDLPGEVHADWYPDGSALLISHEHAGRSTLYRYDLDGGALVELPIETGVISEAAARPDGSVWYVWSDSATPPQVRSTTGEVVLTAGAKSSPSGVRYSDLWVGPIHAFVAEPADRPRPHKTIFYIHGGPDAHDRDSFSPPVQAFVDHGLAVVMVNYRGSTGYGREWRDAIVGNPGFTEKADINAVWDQVVAEGIADPDQIALAGNSWGGYQTLLGLGMEPQRWAVGLAGVPVADFVAAYEDEMETLKFYDRALFGTSPEENLELYEERSPITYVEDVRAPVMILAGENDPRCPIRQIDNYIERLKELGKDHEVLRFDAGHGSYRTEERIRQTEAQLDFLARKLGTTPPL